MKTPSDYAFVDYASQAYSALVLVLILGFHNDTVPSWPWLAGAHAVGILAVHFLVKRVGGGRAGKGVDFLRHFYPVVLYLWFFWETGLLNRMFIHDYKDVWAVEGDQALLGFQPSAWFMEKMPSPVLSEILYASYFSYYVMIVGMGLALFLRDRRQFFHYVSVVSFLFYLCYVVYIFIPIIGPRTFWEPVNGFMLPEAYQKLAPTQEYPEAIRRGPCFHLMGWIYQVFESPGAALPSSHVAVALCTVSFSFRYLRRIRFAHLGLAILLCLSTIYCHYHYAVDVIAGVVTAACLIPLGNHLYFRFQKSAG